MEPPAEKLVIAMRRFRHDGIRARRDSSRMNGLPVRVDAGSDVLRHGGIVMRGVLKQYSDSLT
jgi:hypothetical protein